AGLPRYRCHVGHAYSEASFVAAHGAALETALWTSLRTLQERAELANRLAERMQSRGNERSAERFHRQAHATLDHARVIEGVLTALQPLPTPDEAAVDGA